MYAFLACSCFVFNLRVQRPLFPSAPLIRLPLRSGTGASQASLLDFDHIQTDPRATLTGHRLSHYTTQRGQSQLTCCEIECLYGSACDETETEAETERERAYL